MKKKILTVPLIVIGVLLLLVGVGNIIDDGRVLTYDLTAVLSGAGILILAFR